MERADGDSVLRARRRAEAALLGAIATHKRAIAFYKRLRHGDKARHEEELLEHAERALEKWRQSLQSESR